MTETPKNAEYEAAQEERHKKFNEGAINLTREILPSETQQGLPRERLEKFLEGQEAGSARIQAIADKVALDIIDRRINKEISQRRSSLTESPKPKPDYMKDLFLADLIETKVVRETMRKREFGSDGAEYIAALYEASNISDDYYNYSYKQIRKDSKDKDTSVDEIGSIASSKLLTDLQNINYNKSRKGK